MPITGTAPALAATMLAMVVAELGAPPNPEALKQLKALCTGLANAIEPWVLLAQVAPGILTAGSPNAQVTVSPGVLL